MNALVNSQLAALEKLKETYEHRFGKSFPVAFAKYTGETTEARRDELRNHPPHIILTNYVMGELLLVRPEDQRFLERAAGGLRYLVFDELHTYRGRQGADVAMLIRRIKERYAAPRPERFVPYMSAVTKGLIQAPISGRNIESDIFGT